MTICCLTTYSPGSMFFIAQLSFIAKLNIILSLLHCSFKNGKFDFYLDFSYFPLFYF